MSLRMAVSSSVRTSNPMISHSLLGPAKCWVMTKTCSVVLVALLKTSWVVFVVDGSPSHVRPYDDVNATKNELVTTPATFRNSKMLYHMPERQIISAELSRDSCKWKAIHFAVLSKTQDHNRPFQNVFTCKPFPQSESCCSSFQMKMRFHSRTN